MIVIYILTMFVGIPVVLIAIGSIVLWLGKIMVCSLLGLG